MAGVNSSVVGLKPAAAVPQTAAASSVKRVQVKDRRSALLGLAAVIAVTAGASGSARASVFDEYLEKSKLNKVRIYLCVFSGNRRCWSEVNW